MFLSNTLEQERGGVTKECNKVRFFYKPLLRYIYV